MFRLVAALAVLAAASVGSLAPSMEGQTAKVEAISFEDTVRIKALFAEKAVLDKQMAELQKKIDAFNQVIAQRYLTTHGADKGWCIAAPPEEGFVIGIYTWYKNGWACGAFQYSDDFRFVVPAASPTPNCCPAYIGGNFLVGGTGCTYCATWSGTVTPTTSDGKALSFPLEMGPYRIINN